MEKSRRCNNCKIDVHKASFAKHLSSKEHFEDEKQKNGNI